MAVENKRPPFFVTHQKANWIKTCENSERLTRGGPDVSGPCLDVGDDFWKLSIFLCVCVCVLGRSVGVRVWVLAEARRGVRPSAPGVTGSYDLHAVDSWS